MAKPNVRRDGQVLGTDKAMQKRKAAKKDDPGDLQRIYPRIPPEAVAWCATLYRITEYHIAKTGDWADEDIAHLRSIIALLDALTSGDS